MVASPALTPPGSPPTVQVAMNEGAPGLSKTRDPTLAAADINPCDNVRSRRGAWRHSLLPPPSASGPQRLPSAAFCLSPWSPRYVVCKCAVACTPASAVWISGQSRCRHGQWEREVGLLPMAQQLVMLAAGSFATLVQGPVESGTLHGKGVEDP